MELVDKFLLYRIRFAQDPKAFAQLYDRYVVAIYRFVLLKVPSKEDAEDISSDVFLKLWNYLQEHHDVRHVRALLYQIARHAIADWYRSTSSRRDRSLGVTLSSQDTSSELETDLSDGGRASEVIKARAELSIVMGRLERLKDDYRDILMFRLVDNLPFQLIAKIMEKTPGAVRVLYHRAKKALDALNEAES